MREDAKKGQLTRRAVLAMTAAVPAVVVPVSAARAQRRPPLGSPPSVTIAPTAHQVTASDGTPGVRFTLQFSEPDFGVEYSIYELTVHTTVFRSPDPNQFRVTGNQSFPITASPLTVSGPRARRARLQPRNGPSGPAGPGHRHGRPGRRHQTAEAAEATEATEAAQAAQAAEALSGPGRPHHTKGTRRLWVAAYSRYAAPTSLLSARSSTVIR